MIYNLIHNASETIGLIGDTLKSLNLPFKDVHLYEGDGFPRDTSDLEGLVLMGGPMSVNEVTEYPFLVPEIQLIEKVLSEGKPVLGVCLGSQLIAKALGAKVYKHTVREVGWHPIHLTKQGAADPCFQKIKTNTPVFHWHGETFDLPKDAVHLAASARCENQAFRWGKNTYGLQFHVEVTPSIVREWCASSDGREYAASAKEDAAKIVDATQKSCRNLRPLADDFLMAYFKAAFPKLLPVA